MVPSSYTDRYIRFDRGQWSRDATITKNTLATVHENEFEAAEICISDFGLKRPRRSCL